jgi:hypothetical protein
MGKLFQSVSFVEDDWQELGTRREIAEHNHRFKPAGWQVAATRHGNSGGMSRKSRWITCGRPNSGKGQWKNYS